jgi:hypothetical protein
VSYLIYSYLVLVKTESKLILFKKKTRLEDIVSGSICFPHCYGVITAFINMYILTQMTKVVRNKTVIHNNCVRYLL